MKKDGGDEGSWLIDWLQTKQQQKHTVNSWGGASTRTAWDASLSTNQGWNETGFNFSLYSCFTASSLTLIPASQQFCFIIRVSQTSLWWLMLRWRNTRLGHCVIWRRKEGYLCKIRLTLTQLQFQFGQFFTNINGKGVEINPIITGNSCGHDYDESCWSTHSWDLLVYLSCPRRLVDLKQSSWFNGLKG